MLIRDMIAITIVVRVLFLPWSQPIMTGSKRLCQRYLKTSEVCGVESILRLATPDFQGFITDFSGPDNLSPKTKGRNIIVSKVEDY